MEVTNQLICGESLLLLLYLSISYILGLASVHISNYCLVEISHGVSTVNFFLSDFQDEAGNKMINEYVDE